MRKKERQRQSTRTDVAHLLVDYRRMGLENLLILGGDPPRDGRDEAGDYTYAIEALKIGQPVKVILLRGGKRITLEITPSSRD